MPLSPTRWEYFWHHLPWAVPGFLTFAVGLILFTMAIYAARDAENRPLRLSFALLALGYGCLGLVLALRAVIMDRPSLLFWDTILYAPVLLLGPGSAHLLYYITGRRYPIFYIPIAAFWLAVAYGWYGIIRFEAFDNVFHEFPFGLYPRAGPHLKPWGIIGGVAYLGFVIPVLIMDAIRKRRGAPAPQTERVSEPDETRQHPVGSAPSESSAATSAGESYRELLPRSPSLLDRHRGTLAIHVGVHLLFIAALSNLPSFLGMSVYPGASFSFVPMLLLAYGAFRSDFLDLNDLLFRKNGLFYFLNGLVGLTFAVLSLGVAYGLSPASYGQTAFPFVLFPLISAFSLFAVGILVGGTNPGERSNQLGAFSLYLIGFHMVTVVLHSLGIEPIVVLRLEQLCFVAFSFVAVVQIRFAFLAMERPLPHAVLYMDIVAVICAVLSPTPLLFWGYFEYGFGGMGAAGPVVHVIALVGAIAAGYVLVAWRRVRGRIRGRLADLLVLYIVVTGGLLLSYWPASVGLALYPPGALIAIPTLILAYAILRYGVLPLQTHALRVNNRISSFLLVMSPFFLALYYPTLAHPARTGYTVFHMCLVGAPVLLLVYQVTFLFTRPVSAELDDMYLHLQNEKRAAEEARNIVARQKEELEYEISLAQTIQQALLPRSLPRVPEAELAFRYVPAFSVGGDFVDVHYDERSHVLGLFICDVSGHGVPAALLASMVKMSLDDWSSMLGEPARLLDTIQERLAGKMASHFISALVLSIDLKTGSVRAANAGHPPVLVLGPNGSVKALECKGRILLDHNFDDFCNPEESLVLKQGESLFLYTDGLPEARSPDSAFFGDKAMTDALTSFSGQNPDSVCDLMLEAMFGFTGKRESREDDLTMLAMRYLGPRA